MKTCIKLISLLLIVILTFSSVAACSDKPVSDDTTASETTAAPETDASGETVETEHIYSNDITAVDYEGYTFNMVTNGLSDEYFSALDFDEMTGEALNDAIYERNRRIEEKFNITFDVNNDGAGSQLKASVTAGLQDVDVGYELCESVMGLVAGGYLLPLNALGNIDMTKPYWDQGTIETVMIDGNLYHGYLDISFDHYESMATLFYNGEMLNDYGLDDPFNLYNDGKWTMDTMYSMMQKVSKDVNGDGKITVADDQLGFVGREFQYLPMLYSSNEPLITLSNNGGEYAFELNLASERLYNIGTLIGKMLCDKTISVLARDDATRIMFKEGRALFYSRLLGDFRNLRDKEDDYGIISYPAFDENTEKAHVYVQNPFTIIVPLNAEDRDRTGMIIEALAADTYDNVLDVYFEKAVIGKGARDQNSATMLRSMRERRAFDLSYCYGFTNTAIGAYVTGVESGNFASAASRYANAFNKYAKTNIEAFFAGLDV